MPRSFHPAPALASAPPLGLHDGQLEALKWIGLVSMFIDHIGRHLLGHPQDGWVFALGRIAFPCFALVLGLNLARAGDRAARCARTAGRLAAWCAVAAFPSIWARGDPQVVNVFGTLALGAGLCWAVEAAAPVALRVLACVAIGTAAWWVEFGIGGVFLVAAVYLFALRPEPGLAIVAALLLLATAWLNASFGGAAAFAGSLACLPLLLLARGLPSAIPRWQLLFYAIYPVHLAVIGALKRWG
jgi:hypothetical protein